MREWNVYIGGKYVGTVHAKTETEARLAALHKFDVDSDSLHVSER